MSDTLDTPVTQGGNTVPPVSKPSRNWFLTWNSYPEDWKTQLTQLTHQWWGQLECGESGNMHVQAVVTFKNARHFGAVRDMFPGAHIEVCRDLRASKQYCTKTETRVSEVANYFRDLHCVPHRWQSDILDTVAGEVDHRKIYWYWSNWGGVGKSTFCRHLCLTFNAIMVTGCGRDVFHAIAEMRTKPEVVIFDLPRGASVDYLALEAVKNGQFFSGKYESGMCIFNIPHVIVFSNSEPNYGKLSPDRWAVTEIIPIVI